MKKGHRRKRHKPLQVDKTPQTFLRLCHRCFTLNESPKEIFKCAKCESQFGAIVYKGNVDELNPEIYQEDEALMEAINDFEGVDNLDRTEQNAAEEDLDDEDDDDKGETPPLSGLRVLW